jgi:hypothetical protein
MRNVLVAGQANVHRISSALFYREGTNIFTVLRVEDFRHLWTGQMISFVGDALAYNTLTLAIIRMAHDEGVSAGRLLSLLFVLSALPPLFLGMVAGNHCGPRQPQAHDDRGGHHTRFSGAGISAGRQPGPGLDFCRGEHLPERGQHVLLPGANGDAAANTG